MEPHGETKRRSMRHKYKPLIPNKTIDNVELPIVPIKQSQKQSDPPPPKQGKFGTILPPAQSNKKFTILSGIYGRKKEFGKSVIYTIMGKRTLRRNRRMRGFENVMAIAVLIIVVIFIIISLFIIYVIVFGKETQDGTMELPKEYKGSIFRD